MSIEIHPLVITSICDHYTKVTLGGSILSINSPVIGLIFGTKEGKDISLCDATEAVYSFSNGKVILNHKYIEKKKQLWTAVYTNQQLIGWYCFDKEVTPFLIQLHQQMLSFADSLIFLLMNPDVQISASDLPLNVFEFDSQHNIFVNQPFHLHSTTVEKIAIDQVLKCSPTNGKSSVELQNEALLTSIQSLVSRIDIVILALEKMKSGVIPRNDELLRQISQITIQIPPNIYLSQNLQENFKHELENTLALSLVNMINTDMMVLNELYACYQTIYNKETNEIAGRHGLHHHHHIGRFR